MVLPEAPEEGITVADLFAKNGRISQRKQISEEVCEGVFHAYT